jgi:N,N'-diacetyllegionaminate synthase
MSAVVDLYSVVQRAEAPFVIAEMANAHEGSVVTGRAIIERAASAGANAVKFQKFTGNELLVPYHPRYGHFTQLEMPEVAWSELVDVARMHGLHVLADVFGSESAELMHRLGVDGYKIHSSDTVNHALLRQVAAYGQAVFLSCGGSRQIEILETVRTIREAGNDRIVLLHGFQSYPTRLEDTNLKRIRLLAAQFACPVGFADHVAGDSEWAFMLPVMAIGAGATVIEKHVTLDRARKGIDYYSSLEPDELRRLVGLLRSAWVALGRGEYEMSAAELKYLHEVKKLLVPAVDIPVGTPLQESMVTYKRAPADVHVLTYADVVGRTPKVPLKVNEVISLDQFNLRTCVLVAVRMHSTRLRRKALVPLAGRPAIEHLIDRLKLAKTPASVVLCTSTHPDDDVLVEVAEKTGIKWFRGSEENVMKRFLDAASREEASVVVRVTGDDILVDPAFLDRAVDYHLAKNSEYTAYPGLPKGMETEIISVSALKRAHELAEDPSFTEYMTYYLRRPDVFRVSEMPVEGRYCRPFRLTLDTVEDYRLLQAIFDRLYCPGKIVTTEEIVDLLDARPDLLSINAKVVPKVVVINTNLRIAG